MCYPIMCYHNKKATLFFSPPSTPKNPVIYIKVPIDPPILSFEKLKHGHFNPADILVN